MTRKEAKEKIKQIILNSNFTSAEIIETYLKVVKLASDENSKEKMIRYLENQKYQLKKKLASKAEIKTKEITLTKAKQEITTKLEVLKEEIESHDGKAIKYQFNQTINPIDARNNEFYKEMTDMQKQVDNCLKYSSLYHSCDVKYFELEDKEGNVQTFEVKDKEGNIQIKTKTIPYFVDKRTKEIVAPFTNADAIGLNIQNLSVEANNLLKKNKQTGELELDLEKLKELNKKINEYTKTYKLIKSVDNSHLYRTKAIQEMIVDQQKALFISSQNDKLRDEIGATKTERKNKQPRDITESLNIQEIEREIKDLVI